MSDGYTIKDVTKDLGSLLQLTKLFVPDDQGFWYDDGTKTRFVHKLDAEDAGKEIVLFQDPIPRGDFYIFNPFAEGFGKKSPATTFFYQLSRIALNLNLRNAILYMVRAVLDSKEAAASKSEHTLSHVVVRISSIPIEKRTSIYDAVDEKMLDELEKLFDRVNDEFIFVPYFSQQMTAKVMCDALTDPKWDDKYNKDIRKKTIATFKAALMGILGISTPDELSQFSVKFDTSIKSAARFHTTMEAYLKLYSRFNDVLAEISGIGPNESSRDVINLDEFANVIERFPLAYAIAKHMVQPSLPKSSATDTRTADTSALRIGGQPLGSKLPGGSRFPGPEVVDNFGRRSGSPLLNLSQQNEGSRRFQPHVISDVPVDPFAPALRANNASSFGGGFGNSRPVSSGYFGGGSSFGGGTGGALDFGASSGFDSPGVRRYSNW